MDIQKATEQAYKNGYEKGSKETSEKILKFVLNMAHFDLDGQLVFPVNSLRNYTTNELKVEVKE